MINSSKAQLEYFRDQKKVPNIPFLDK